MSLDGAVGGSGGSSNVDITMNVEGESGTFRAVHRITVEVVHVPSIQPGKELPVLWSPHDRRIFAIDTEL